MTNVSQFPDDNMKNSRERLEKLALDKSGGPPYDGGMEARVAKLEVLAEKTSERLGTLERDVAVIKSNYSTKADVAEAKNSIIMWVVSAILLAQLLPVLLKKFGL